MLEELKKRSKHLQNDDSYKSEKALHQEMTEKVAEAVSGLESSKEEIIDKENLNHLLSLLKSIDLSSAVKSSTIRPRFQQIIDYIEGVFEQITIPHPSNNEEARTIALNSLPKFVYYSNYGNLDSEIYLPHVIQNLERKDLGGKEEARARTLKVLFEFVRLQPKEIWELGKELDTGQAVTEEKIKEFGDKKKEREILLQSASTELTTKFRDWWRQGDYRFRFQADGNHFRIWVSDDRRPEEIELEGRSAGLQWFLSFFLVFLVEGKDSHEGTILLLDEPGHSLHPLAQQDLSFFFANLSSTNQILYTTHSLHMIDPNHFDRVRSVYVDEKGTTLASSDLRASVGNEAHKHSIYPVQGALGLSTAEAYLYGCQSVIVEGPSDQFYFTALKAYLIREGKISPSRELAFIPAGGASGIKTTAPIVSARDGLLPPVVVDSDKQGKAVAENLKKTLYAGNPELIIEIGDFVDIENSEVEDLVGFTTLNRVATRQYRGHTRDFDEISKPDEAIIPQIESFAQDESIDLDKGWKVELAKKVKDRILLVDSNIEDERIEKWIQLFNLFDQST